MKKTTLIALLIIAAGTRRASAACVVSAGTWQNTALTAQTGTFTATFSAVPSLTKMDGVIGLAAAPASAYTALAAAVRFNNAGNIDARNGGAYAATAAIPYTAGQTYRFRLVVSMATRTYNAFVTPPGAAERQFASGYAFRTEQASVSSLSNIALLASTGSESVCDAVATAADTTPPVIGGLAVSAVGQNTATVSWTTNEAATGQVDYGPTTAYGASSALNATLTTGHSEPLSGLTAGTLYHYRVRSRDAAGNFTTSPDATFTTAAAPPSSTASLSENFSSYPKNVCLADGAVFGPWTSEFNGYGCTSVKTDGTTSWLEQAPIGSPMPSETHASLVLGPSFPVPLTFSARMTTVAQLRTGSAPNAWEVAWLTWSYTDNVHFYYFALKPNGWELGKADPAYPGAQRFLATGSSPAYPIGSPHVVKVVQTQNTISVTVDGVLLTTFTDNERPYLGGRIGLYNEDARVRFTDIAVNADSAPTTPPPAPVVALDKLGVAKLYPTMAGGTEWTSNWANGVTRTFGWGDDPQDSWFHGKGDATYKVDGKGQLLVSGAVPRLYLYDPTQTKSWRGVEMTVYAKRVSDTGISYGGIVGVARTNHTANNSNLCDTRGMAARFRYDGRVDLEKETSHPSSTVVNSKVHFTGGMPYGAWIGWKYVVYDLPNGDVKLESYMDMSDGADGGNWVKVNELTDTGKNFGVGGARCKPGMDPALRLTASNTRAGSETGKPNLSVYWRSDGVGTDGLIYKKMSVREIAPSGAYSSLAELDAPTEIPIAAAGADAKAPQKFLSPALADGINDTAVFGTDAAEVSIFSVGGRLVFHGSRQGGGPIVWNGKDGSGRVHESGVYIAKIKKTDSGVLYQSFALVK